MMEEEVKKILKMVEEKKITSEEAEKLIELLELDHGDELEKKDSGKKDHPSDIHLENLEAIMQKVMTLTNEKMKAIEEKARLIGDEAAKVASEKLSRVMEENVGKFNEKAEELRKKLDKLLDESRDRISHEDKNV